VVLPTGYACALSAAPRSALGSAVHALTLLVQQRLVLEVAAFADRVELVVLPPLCPLSVSSADFRFGDELVARAHRASGAWLDDGGHRRPHPEQVLSLHDHHARTDARHVTGGNAA
jgi:NTE family protein